MFLFCIPDIKLAYKVLFGKDLLSVSRWEWGSLDNLGTRGQIDRVNIVASHLPVTGQSRKTARNIKSWWEGATKFHLDPAEMNTHNSCEGIILQQTASSHSASTCSKISQGNNCDNRNQEYFCYLVSESRTHLCGNHPFPIHEEDWLRIIFSQRSFKWHKASRKISHLYMDGWSSQKMLAVGNLSSIFKKVYLINLFETN